MLARSALLACDFLSLFFTLLFICLIQLTQLLRDTLRHHHHFPFLKQFNYFLQGCFVPASQLFLWFHCLTYQYHFFLYISWFLLKWIPNHVSQKLHYHFQVINPVAIQTIFSNVPVLTSLKTALVSVMAVSYAVVYVLRCLVSERAIVLALAWQRGFIPNNEANALFPDCPG